MFSDFEWNDILLSHYLVSLIISVFALLVTYVVSKRYNIQLNKGNKDIIISNNIKNSEEELDSSYSDLSTPRMKKSPALAAEKVIKANMTKEQQLLEYQVRQKQLAQIHKLMLKQSEKFGKISLSDVEEQMKLYQ